MLSISSTGYNHCLTNEGKYMCPGNHYLTNPFVALFLSYQLIKINNSPLDLHKAQFSGKDAIYTWAKSRKERRRKIQTPCLLKKMLNSNRYYLKQIFTCIHSDIPRNVTWNLRNEWIGGIWNVMFLHKCKKIYWWWFNDVVMRIRIISRQQLWTIDYLVISGSDWISELKILVRIY